ncbi:MAG: hypothetical protein V1682_05825 [Candidatus Omnitrophota bacterium]
MRRNSAVIVSIFLTTAFVVSGCGIGKSAIHLVDAKIATAVDENLMPVKVTDIFPKGTDKVSCWIKWNDTQINTQLVASWHYITDDIHVLDYSFIIPKKEGMGSVVLAMPNGKNLPSGEYKVDLILGNRVLKSLTFRIE